MWLARISPLIVPKHILSSSIMFTKFKTYRGTISSNPRPMLNMHTMAFAYILQPLQIFGVTIKIQGSFEVRALRLNTSPRPCVLTWFHGGLLANLQPRSAKYARLLNSFVVFVGVVVKLQSLDRRLFHFLLSHGYLEPPLLPESRCRGH
jgi:hypothetical protein